MLNFKPREFLKLLREILAELKAVHREQVALRKLLEKQENEFILTGPWDSGSITWSGEDES